MAYVRIQVHQCHHHLASVAGVDEPGCVDNGDTVACRQAATSQHQPTPAVLEPEGDSGTHHCPAAGRSQFDSGTGMQVHSGIAHPSRDGKGQVRIKPNHRKTQHEADPKRQRACPQAELFLTDFPRNKTWVTSGFSSANIPK